MWALLSRAMGRHVFLQRRELHLKFAKRVAGYNVALHRPHAVALRTP